ncbi:alpha-amylase family glycosyl hydrolase [Rhodothermus marinus]|uniref:alpha-amylase family glycosyl hydrolase n=1 Tax=Rhodothermus marinus TaxID=29549 RepID=UPI001FB35F41|nr:alpha-amylase family glycosyl hydrolase [Rhodothermus marinus]
MTDFERPPAHELVIYELLIRDFVARHDYATLIDTLDYLERLGVNAIELMPVAEFDGNISWGYNPAFHLALDKYYGPADDLKRFVDECHRRGIASSSMSSTTMPRAIRRWCSSTAPPQTILSSTSPPAIPSTYSTT